MDDDTRQFLMSLVSGLENNLRREIADLRREMRETESRILRRTDESIGEAKVELLAV